MFLLFFLIWIIFNGQITWETAAFGIVVSAFMYVFICRFMGYKPRMDLLLAKKFFLILQYVYVLIKEIIKANYAVIKMIMSSRYEMEPTVVRFKTNLKTTPARILLANSITLTPGTITISLESDEYIVHCLDRELAKGMNNSLFVTLLERLERMD